MSQNNIDFIAREKFQNRIQKGMLGPGSDTWGLPDEEEIISNDTPLQRYFSGILFPEKSIVQTQDEEDQADLVSSSEIEEDEFEIEDQDLEDENSFKSSENDADKISKTNFFPTNIGLSFCIPASIKEIDVMFSFGLYYQPTNSDIKIKIPEQGFQSFFDSNLPFQLPFRDILKYEDGYMALARELKGFAGGKGKPRSEEYLEFDEFKKTNNLIDSSAKYFIGYLEKIVTQGRIWRRIPINISKSVKINNTDAPILLQFDSVKHSKTKVGYNIRVINEGDKNFVKIQLVNLSEKQSAQRFSNKNEQLNYKSIFQAKITVNSNSILPFNSSKTFNSEFQDNEAKELEYIYRSVMNYCIGHNCSSMWNEDHTSLNTTFLPTQDINDVTNTFGAQDKQLSNALKIYNLSIWGFDKKVSIEHLDYFVDQYSKWINDQQELSGKEDLKYKEQSEQIIGRQKENLNRLKENIQLLNDDKIFRCFQLANTAMFIQLITSNDSDFGKNETDYNDTSTKILNDISFFENYNAEERIDQDKIGFYPAYRPFQLAFLLLSLDGIVNPLSKSRKEIVDLIWFPTGGGKTEAYLAVTAFTIVFRRLMNSAGFDGTSVIMRYTLRLLTAQQFERASRLITALEFLRSQPDFNNELKDEPITIGLWVGMGSTPNTIQEAKSQIEKIEKEFDRPAGSPETFNTFQISSCPWCGTKLITKKPSKRSGKLVWASGFKYTRSNGFFMHCNNDSCACNEKIPVQVVDEQLYENPPTLLFGTVDKFAMIAWQEKAHRFFNSLDQNKLPPDLIIQDELHLLSGPLGSITGIFESVIESLCTRGDIGPKIIASTATTRNTDYQIGQLYGNRSVNIFPPSGINYNDSFFAKESSNTKRRYVGFMPTGKTAIDTQLQILAHLLVARLEVYNDPITKDAINNYWTIVSYYNSLKDVGKIFNKVGDEVSTFTSTLQHRLSSLLLGDFKDYTFNYLGLSARTQELTSRVESTKIKSVLSEIEKPFNPQSITRSSFGNTYINDVIDFVLATNMISVGIDISKLNVMLINGMPKNIAEYIQASSRVGRSTKGLAIALMNPSRAREKSYFEHFNNFHQAFYKRVEPLSITPFTENTIDKMLASILVAYVRNKLPGRTGNKDVIHFQKEDIEGLKTLIRNRFGSHTSENTLFQKKVDDLAYDWLLRVQKSGITEYKQLLKKPTEKNENQDWILMQSMREIDSNTYINIKETY